MDVDDKIQRLRMKYSFTLGNGLIDDFMELIELSRELHHNREKIRYAFTDDEYGEAARKLYRERGPLVRSYQGDAGIDLPVVFGDSFDVQHGKVIWSSERQMLHTGIKMEFPMGYWGRIVHRSSTEKKHRLRVIEGIIDDYRGEILIQVHNSNTSNVTIHHGDRLAQIILARTAPFELVESNELRPSERGSKGFGSSGK